MNKLKIFKSSAQSEFATERQDLFKEPEFLLEDGFKTIIWRPEKETDFPTGQAEEEGNSEAYSDDIKLISIDLTGQPTGQPTGQATGQATEEATGEATRKAEEDIIEMIKRVVLVLNGEMKRAEIQDMLGLKHRENFVSNYLVPSLDSAFIEMTIPGTPNHQDQRYRLTPKGIDLKKKLKKNQKKK